VARRRTSGSTGPNARSAGRVGASHQIERHVAPRMRPRVSRLEKMTAREVQWEALIEQLRVLVATAPGRWLEDGAQRIRGEALGGLFLKLRVARVTDARSKKILYKKKKNILLTKIKYLLLTIKKKK